MVVIPERCAVWSRPCHLGVCVREAQVVSLCVCCGACVCDRVVLRVRGNPGFECVWSEGV